MGGNRRIDLRNSSTLFLLRGRYVTGKPRIWSVKDFNSRVKYVHANAREGDPFAIECMSIVESKIDELDLYLDERIGKTEADIAVSGIKIDRGMKVEATVEIDERYCSLGVKAFSLLVKIDRYHTSRCCASMAGILEYRSGIESKQVNRKYNGLKQIPFAWYKDYGIRSVDVTESVDWRNSVKRLGMVPTGRKYNPKYFVVVAQS